MKTKLEAYNDMHAALIRIAHSRPVPVSKYGLAVNQQLASEYNEMQMIAREAIHDVRKMTASY